MTRIELDPGERVFWHWPVVGSGATPEVNVGAGWVAMQPATGWTPDEPVVGATWWRVMFARDDVDTGDPDIGVNPAGTIVVTAPVRISGRIVASIGGEVLVEKEIGWVIPT